MLHYEQVFDNVFERRESKCCAVLMKHRRKVKSEQVINLQMALNGYLWVFRLNPFSILWSTFFFSRRLRFFWSPCLLLIAESISLDTSGKPAVVFFLKITAPS